MRPVGLRKAPRLATWILLRVLSDEEKEFVLGDLAEGSSRMSPLRARFWYWRQTLGFLRTECRPRAPNKRRGDGIMRGIVQDLRYGIRVLAKAPGFAAVASLTLAVGVGANATIFSWLNGVLITLLPGVDHPHGLVAVLPKSSMQEFTTISYPDYVDFRDRTSTLSGLFVADDITVNLGGEEQPERVWGQLVSGNFFDVLGVEPILGRWFLPEEDRVRNERPVVVLSHRLWIRRFGGDPSLIGRTISINETEFVVVGVAPPDFQGSEIGLAYDLWVPMMMQEKVLPGRNRLDERNNSWLVAIGRLAPGVSLGEAQAELDGIARNVASEHERPDDRRGAIVVSLWRSPRGAPSVLGPVLLMLLAVTGLVLLIACANVANLLLARATGRRKEIAVRLALGAGRGRILRQLLTESLILSATSALAGVVLTYWTSGLLRSLAPPTDLPIGLALGVDLRVWAFTFAVALLAAVAFGLAPAVHALRSSVVAPLKEESSSVAGGRGKAWLRSALVLSQVTLSLVLLITAGLFLKSLRNVRTFDPGFEPKGVLLAAIDLFPSGYTSEKGRAFYVELLERVRSVPGVESASLARRVPLGFGGSSSSTLRIEGREPRKGAREWAYINNVSPDYFRTMKMPLLRGRDFTIADNPTAPRVAIVNETMARTYWPSEDALGRRFSYGDDQWFTVVGIVADSKYRSLTEETAAFTYLPVLQFFRTDVTLHLRTSGDPKALASAVQAELHALDPALPLYDVRPLEEHVLAASFQQRMAGTLLSVLGALALLLAGVGISSVVAYTASQRTREIGIRIALGASRRDVLGLIVRQGMWVVSLGLVAGVAVSLAATKLLRSLLFGTSPTDPVTFALVTAVLLGVGLAASYLPARRATRVDPVAALRYE